MVLFTNFFRWLGADGHTYLYGANELWSNTLGSMQRQLGESPMGGVWGEAFNFVLHVLFPWSEGIGIVLLNLFFLIGFYRAVSNIRENLTSEIFIMAVLKLIVANALLRTFPIIASSLFVMASLLVMQIQVQPNNMVVGEFVGESSFLIWFLQILYYLFVFICTVILHLAVFGRYLRIYVMFVLAPIALSTFVGGRETGQTGSAWVKAFLNAIFVVVVMAIILAVGTRIIYTTGWDQTYGDANVQFLLRNVVMMALITGAVKGADKFLKEVMAI